MSQHDRTGADTLMALAEEIRGTVPRGPGVYAFVDPRGMLLYIGKSVNLRQRMRSYFGRRGRSCSGTVPSSADAHLKRLVAGTAGFAWWRTRSELLALLLEDALIKEFLPPHNTRQREFPENRYLELTDDDFPACLVIEHGADPDESDVYGPLKDRYFAEALQGIVHGMLGIRTCRDHEPRGRCLDHDIGLCAGPCRGVATQGAYADAVERARAFLRGDVRDTMRLMRDMRDRASADRRFEEAARLQDALEVSRRFAERARFERRFAGGTIEVGADGVNHRFVSGALAEPEAVVVAVGRSRLVDAHGRGAFHPEEAARRAVALLHRQPADDRRFLSDRARIVGGWLRRHGDGRNDAGLREILEA